MRIGIYARVSTKDQSCDLQLRDLRAYCAARGFSVQREYVDVGESGAKDSRPQLNELMAAARKRLNAISPLACVSFIHAWRADLDVWGDKLLGLPVVGDLAGAAKFLELPAVDSCVTP